ncbi:hypothetical protein ACFP65_03745 [Marinilactibacillus sp. GCM10026970]|uniref:hypothetical protein n=1 Tax=Marinilactibacillus sp. GCM10026970 TaxID=3252642 RepID=UPI003620D1CC
MRIINHKEVESLKKQLIDIQTDSDDFYSKTVHRLLDVFSHTLNMEEAHNISFAFEDLYLKYENKYLLLFKELYNQSPDQSIIIEMPYNEISEQMHLAVLDQVDRFEQFQWIKLLKQTDEKTVSHFFEIESFEELKLMYQINSREVFFCNIHFKELGFSLRGHFDRSMEVFFESEKIIKWLTGIVEKNGLFLRKYPEELERGL